MAHVVLLASEQNNDLFWKKGQTNINGGRFAFHGSLKNFLKKYIYDEVKTFNDIN